MGAYSRQQRKRFHKDVMDFKQCYEGQYNESMWGNYVCGLIRECTIKQRRSRKNIHF